MAESYPIIRVFITKGYKFRAVIKESEKEPAYEVTIGGRNWKMGKGTQHTVKIMNKCNSIIKTLKENLQ